MARKVRKGGKDGAKKWQEGCKERAKRVREDCKEGARKLQGGSAWGGGPPGCPCRPGPRWRRAGGTRRPELRSLAPCPALPSAARPARGGFPRRAHPRCPAGAYAEEPRQRPRACSALPCTICRPLPGEGAGEESRGGSLEPWGCCRAAGPGRRDTLPPPWGSPEAFPGPRSERCMEMPEGLEVRC